MDWQKTGVQDLLKLFHWKLGKILQEDGLNFDVFF